MREAPYFLNNEDWYTVENCEDGSVIYELTENAPTEAIESYERYYSEPVIVDENENDLLLDGWVCDA